MQHDSPKNTEILSTAFNSATDNAEHDDTERPEPHPNRDIAVPKGVAGSGSLERLVETARDYASQATAENTNKAYKKDWAHFASWCRRRGADPLSGPVIPDPQLIGLYITEMASPQENNARSTSPARLVEGLSVATIERRLSGLSWNYQQRGLSLDRRDRHIATVLAGIKRKHGKPPKQKEALFAEDIMEMIATIDFGLRGLRDKALLLLGFAGGLRRSEIVSLDAGSDQTEDGKGWIEVEKDGIFITLNTKTGWREVEIGRGSSETTCPVYALEQWLYYSKIVHGPLFRAVTRDNAKVTSDRLSDKHIARLIKKTARKACIRPELSDTELMGAFSGHSLRAGLASSAQVDERHVQKQLGHTSIEMTRRYQRRRDRFKVNLTKAAGL